MFEVFTTRIANQHIMLQAIRTGLLNPGTCEEGRRFIALLERWRFRGRAIGAHHRFRRLRFGGRRSVV